MRVSAWGKSCIEHDNHPHVLVSVAFDYSPLAEQSLPRKLAVLANVTITKAPIVAVATVTVAPGSKMGKYSQRRWDSETMTYTESSVTTTPHG